jgi:hypothetical protein
MRKLVTFAGILAALGLFWLTPARTAHAGTAPNSGCNANFTVCTLYESDGNGNPSEIGNAVSAPGGFSAFALLENPLGAASDPHNWSDVVFITCDAIPGGCAAHAHLVSQGCNNPNNPADISCFPASVNSTSNETSTGQGNDFTDSTSVFVQGASFNTTYTVYSDCACPTDREGGPPGVELPDAPMAMMLPVAALGVISVATFRFRRRRISSQN